MQVILNWILLFITYFLAQIFLYRFFKININKHSVILLVITISTIVGFYFFSLETLINLININLMVICFYIIMPGIINDGPALTIINLIENKKINKKKKLKKLFLKSRAGKAIEKRVKLNITSNFLKLKKGRLTVNKNAEKLIIFFNLIKKIYRLKSDAY